MQDESKCKVDCSIENKDLTSKKILFYGPRNIYGELSNMYPCTIEIDGKIWPSTEHYYQAMKFNNKTSLGISEDCQKYMEKIRAASTGFLAKKMASKSEAPLKIRADWEEVKNDLMKRALVAKFTQNKKLKQFILKTGDAVLIENSPYDYYWGCGAAKNGKNMLGRLLMDVREFLRLDS